MHIASVDKAKIVHLYVHDHHGNTESIDPLIRAYVLGNEKRSRTIY